MILAVSLLIPASAAVAVVLMVVARRRLIVVDVEGLSMQPEYEPGDRVLVRRGVIPRRGQVVVVKRPAVDLPEWAKPLAVPEERRSVTAQGWMIKRVAGTSGDSWWSQETGTEHLIPEGHLYLLGDNPERSLDSRLIGLIPVDQLLGTVWKRL
ncbi:signal peptidase I [Streptomyces dangxiongensis]|uniref:Signal peptidase I n=1 Tax=Streptomyces dangxiongensis TaxID=1442032 RepID=A0A3G2JG49_9ACTN|nr:signal peptidase I [Streptomyces dangxiongensis]AYN39609.1 signal peptidase I [Streptomyces dangxiongensis]